MRYVNLGCGSRFHPDWINIDLVPQRAGVIAHDLRRGIPLEDSSCDAVYHSNVLEHLRRNEAQGLMRECHRVLKSGGVLRVGVPDIERLCRLYLETLEAVRGGKPGASHNYEWIMLELYDQTARERTGGGMLEYLRQDPIPNEAFVYGRIGEEGRETVRQLRAGNGVSMWGTRVRRLRWRLRHLPGMLYRDLAAWTLGFSGRRAFAIGRFRLSGEVHHWMYDSYSLAALIRTAGFIQPVQHSATDSSILGWEQFCLDALTDGTVIKPDTLFMEAIKPGGS